MTTATPSSAGIQGQAAPNPKNAPSRMQRIPYVTGLPQDSHRSTGAIRGAG